MARDLKKLEILLDAIILYCFCFVKSQYEAIVQTSQGFVQGLYLKSVMSEPYFSFRGIPYAAPPVRELRFKAPQPPMTWNGLRNAKTEGAACIQPFADFHVEEKYSENCLFINVHTPQIKVHNENELLPVMVWIHGGNFIKGSGHSHKYGADFFLAENVVLVTFNYRLGVFGFLNMGTADCQGNAGLKDQVAALKWVGKEIRHFGGNPNLVTIFGEGSGAVSVNHLYLSPLSQGLFHQAISQSGSSLCSFAYQESTYELGQKLAEILSCPTTDPQLIVSCLKDADVNDLAVEQLNGAISLDKLMKFGNPFIPTLEQNLGEEVFLPKSPLKLIKAGRYNNIPYIFGFNNKEGGSFINDFLIANYDPQNHLGSFLPKEFLERSSSATIFMTLMKLKAFYFGKYDSPYGKIDNFVKFLTDRYFTYDIIHTAHLLDQKNVYLYYFQQTGDYVQSGDVCKLMNIKGVCHGGELGYMFYSNTTTKGHNNFTAGSKDMITLQRMVRLWTNFAKYGEPTVNIKDPLLSVTWVPIARYSNHYLNIEQNLNMTFVSLMLYSTYVWDTILGDPDTFRMKLGTTYNDYETLTVDPREGFWIVGVVELVLVFLIIIVVTVKAYSEHVDKRSQYTPV